MNWERVFAERTRLMRRGTVREFLKLAGKPGVISFAGGLPAPELFPVKEVENAAAKILRTKPAAALQYGPSEGTAELRERIACEWSTRLDVTAENVLITSGAQQALDLLGRVLLNEGDKVALENPTYLSVLSAWRPLAVHFHNFNTWDWPREAKALYLIPNFRNPTGESMSEEERRETVSRLRNSNCVLIEDDPYGELRFEGSPVPSLLEIAGDAESNVVYCGTSSKVLSPGLRVGWVVGARELVGKLVQAKQAMDLHSSGFNQLIVAELFENGAVRRHIPELRRVYGERRDHMLRCMEREFPAEASWTTPQGGMFIFVTLPAGFQAREIARELVECGVLVVPGGDFHISGGENTFRLNFTNSPHDKIEEGIKRIGDLLARKMKKPAETIPAG